MKQHQEPDLANPAQWNDAMGQVISSIARQALIIDLQRLDTDDPKAFVDASDMALVEATNAVTVWKLWPNHRAHLIGILDPTGPRFVLIGRRPTPSDVYLAQYLFLLGDLTTIAAVHWSDCKAA